MEIAKPKTLNDFPKFVVTAVRRGATSDNGYTQFEIEGNFDPILQRPFDEIIKGKGPQWFWLLFGECGCLTPMLKSFDQRTKTAILICDEKEKPNVLGVTLAYLSPYWQAFNVWMVLDPNWGWERRQFQGTDAVAEDYEATDVSLVDGRQIRVWTKLEPTGGNRGQSRHYPAADQSLPVRSGTRLVPGAWGHEHCELCHEHIDAGMFGYCDPGDRWMCERCHRRYVGRRDLAFVDDLRDTTDRPIGEHSPIAGEIRPNHTSRRSVRVVGNTDIPTQPSLKQDQNQRRIKSQVMFELLVIRESKIFDPRDPSAPSYGCELLDPSVAQRGDVWWMFLAGQLNGHGSTDLFSANLPSGSSLAATGWKPLRDAAGELTPLAGRDRSSRWDGKGGRHCPSYVKGWDPKAGAWVERIYYAGAAENLGGPYTIGFLEWDGQQWVDQPEPAFISHEDWEHGSVYEPNLLYHNGKWKMWYVAGANHEDHLIHGYAESADGRTGWSKHLVFAAPEMKMFDFCVRQRKNGYDAVFARVWMGRGEMPQETGLWWCHSKEPSALLSDWGQPVQIMTAEDRGWHAGPWKPSLQFDSDANQRGFVFFDGSYRTDDPGPFPYVFTLGCVEVDLRT